MKRGKQKNPKPESPRSLRAIGRELGISAEMVRLIEYKALRKMAVYLRERGVLL